MFDVWGRDLHISSDTIASRDAVALQSWNPVAADIMRQLAQIPSAYWLRGDSTGDTVDEQLEQADGKLHTIVCYQCPLRDLDGYSAGGASSEAAYVAYVQNVASGIRGRQVEIVLEPDALAMAPEIKDLAKREERFRCLRQAAEIFADAGANVLLDLGDSGWTRPEPMLEMAMKSGLSVARGIVSNVAHYRTLTAEHAYGKEVQRLAKERHGLRVRRAICSRGSGIGAPVVRPGEEKSKGWCNPDFGFGPSPTTRASKSAFPDCDGLRFVKSWASDGSREGQPKAGAPYWQLMVRAHYAAKPPFPRV